MHTRPGDIHSGRQRVPELASREIDDRTLEDFLERMTEAGWLTLLHWARGQAGSSQGSDDFFSHWELGAVKCEEAPVSTRFPVGCESYRRDYDTSPV
jgi:hypothetical protein